MNIDEHGGHVSVQDNERKESAVVGIDEHGGRVDFLTSRGKSVQEWASMNTATVQYPLGTRMAIASRETGGLFGASDQPGEKTADLVSKRRAGIW